MEMLGAGYWIGVGIGAFTMLAIYFLGGGFFLRLANKILNIPNNKYRNMVGISIIGYLTLVVGQSFFKLFMPIDPMAVMEMAGRYVLIILLLMIGNVFIKALFLSYYTGEKYARAIGASWIGAVFTIVGSIVTILIIEGILLAILPGIL